MRLSTRLLPLTAAAVIGLSGVAMAKVVKLHATLAPGPDVTGSMGKGKMTGHYNTTTHMLYWHVKFSHLTSKETMAHFHGPAKPGENAPVLVPIAGMHASPLSGHAKITADQAKVLMDGMSYVNVHSVKFPAGEVRGQVEAGS